MKTNIKNKYQRSHQVRIGAVAIAMATAFHVSGLATQAEDHEDKRIVLPMSLRLAREFSTATERENETTRHMVHFDGGLRLPSSSGL